MIEVKSVSKSYQIVEKDAGLWGAVKALFVRRKKTVHAVRNIHFTISQGEMVAYIGANGAGKSTTIKLLCGILTPSEGIVRINGIEPSKQRIQNAGQIGAVFGQRSQLMWDLAVRESYELLKRIYEIPDTQYRDIYDRCVDVLQLEPLLNVPVRQLSLGQKMRCELAAAFLHRPSIVYLDEPTIGLDVSVKARIRQFIKEMNRTEKTTIILTSHDMQDIEALCDRVIIIDQGTIAYDGHLDQLRSSYGQQRIVVFHCEPNATWQLPQSLEGHVTVKHPDGLEEEGVVEIGFDRQKFTATEIISAVMSVNQVLDLTIREGGIESIVRAIYEREQG